MSNESLEKCPFCSGDADLVTKGEITAWYYVFCLGCLMRTKSCETDDQAIELWNRRA